MKLLLAIYAALLVDLFTGLNLNLFGYGREPLLFAFATVMVASTLYVLGRHRLGMIALFLCCAWLVLYPNRNGFDVVLSPTLLIACAAWLLQKLKRKQ